MQLLPLRQRIDDIQPLAEQILQRHSEQQGRNAPQLSQAAIDQLLTHQWPGNVRELDNVLQRALILQPGMTLSPEDLAFEAMSQLSVTAETPLPVTTKTAVTMDEDEQDTDLRGHEQRHILDTLSKYRGSRRQTAKELGISERTLRYKISRFREQGIAIPGKSGKQSA